MGVHIRVHEDTYQRLRELKERLGRTYDDVIRHLLDVYEAFEKTGKVKQLIRLKNILQQAKSIIEELEKDPELSKVLEVLKTW